MKCTKCNAPGQEGFEMDLIWSHRTDSCESGCCESYVRMYQCPRCKGVEVKE